MPRHDALLLLILCVALLGGCAPGPAVAQEAEADALLQRQSDLLEALSAKDLEQIMVHFAEDAVLHIANMPPVRGHGAVRRLYENVFRFMSAAEYDLESVEVSPSGDMAYSMGSVTTVFDSERGRVDYPGKFLMVWQNRDDQWSVVAYSISNNRPDSAP